MSAIHPIGKQIDAVESTAQQLLLVAPPGCGKTEVIAMRAHHLVTQGTIREGRRLLAITYSKRARDNMARRIQQSLGHERTRGSVTVQNFHGLSARIVRAHGRTLGIPEDVLLPSKRWFSDTVSPLTSDWDARGEAETLLRKLKSQPIDDDELLELVVASRNQIAFKVEEARRLQNKLDYPDLLRHAQRLLHVPQIANLYQQHFDALLVDEFQDLSQQQLDIVSLAAPRNAMYVGDPLQGIYSWAGAEPATVEAELVARCAERVDLDISYRSSPEVLAVVNAVARPLGAVELSAADPDAWDPSGHAYAFSFDTDVEEAAGIVRVARRLVRKYPTESIGVITRSRYRRGQVDIAMSAAADIPVQTWDMSLDTPGLLTTLKSAARGIKTSKPLTEQLQLLFERAAAVIGDDDVETINELTDAISILREKAVEGESIRDALARFREVHVTDAIAPGVHLLNAHIGKGQQFDWVVVLGLEEGSIPAFQAKTAEEIAEEERVLMVMLSRAKRGLIITKSARTTNKYGLRVQRESRWWSTVAGATETVATATENLVRGT
ncbi:UvrD-helicase domain-containing protein [Subtercola frigoramans]|uniref:DNA 3'-5' helicase n=1 Tax=Subtercola frigoramans TaxID=120298 RepID=A0ABS2L647_9MICO|nr:ATP-dependent helicase [Subtercola frigoramans]MBM7472489.1 DNA helicase-2/ATP-dependent DNA helicase PcrA [Subtercola frigoramans]